jgi:hypothetical protein
LTKGKKSGDYKRRGAQTFETQIVTLHNSRNRNCFSFLFPVISCHIIPLNNVFHQQETKKWYLPRLDDDGLTTQSRSGVAVDPSCAEAFQALKLSKNTKFIIFKLNDEKTSIVVSKQSSDSDYDTFLAVIIPPPHSPLSRDIH